MGGFIRRLFFILSTSNGSISRALKRSTLKYPGLKHEATPGFPHAQHCLSTRNHPLLGADATFFPQMLGADALFFLFKEKSSLFARHLSARERMLPFFGFGARCEPSSRPNRILNTLRDIEMFP